ncbi:MAG TPA: MoxR family ATPase [Candidatus Krumholzibacteria bacterium]|nr:MoxR family ATPase [Candidatus Krumholzibacteria bacterium]
MDDVRKFNQTCDTLRAEIGKVIVGQDTVVEELLIALFAGGHCLLVGVPGLAKTLLISTVAQALDLKFSRIQFTPDLMPSDITGTEILEEDAASKKRTFRFIQGPIFGNVILADEINRTPPKTQAALLQAMQEKKVTAGGQTYALDLPFFVLATQNPIEQEGTYPLPEAQLDRFMFNVRVDYPSEEEEIQIVESTTSPSGQTPTIVLHANDILETQTLVRTVPVDSHVLRYAIRLVRATRDDSIAQVKQYVSWGAGPRAGQNLILGAKVRAVMNGRPIPSVEDIRAIAHPVLRHRIVTNFNADADGISTDNIIDMLLEGVEE